MKWVEGRDADSQAGSAAGQRIGEVAGIAISELDLNDTAPTLAMSGDRLKNDQSHRMPLSPLAVTLIREAMFLRDPNQGE